MKFLFIVRGPSPIPAGHGQYHSRYLAKARGHGHTGAVTAPAQTREAGRGVLSMTGAKLYFIVMGYTVQLALPRLLGTPEAFGLYSAAMSVVSILNNLLIVATIQTVSRQVSRQAHGGAQQEGTALRQGLRIQLLVGAALALGLVVAAPGLALVKGDPRIVPLLRTAAIVLFCYAVYATLVGSLNGRRRFLQQAGLDITYSTLRTVGILGAAALGLGALGAFQGFAAAAVLVLCVALWKVGTGAPGGKAPLRAWLSFMAPLWAYHLCLNLILQFDLFLVTSSVTHLSAGAGMAADAASALGNRYGGFYRAAQTFAFVPYQLILSVAFVVFPMVSSAVSVGDAAATRSYIRSALRFSLIVLVAIAAPVSGAAAGVMRIAYQPEYLAGAPALAVLSPGMACFALFVVGATILSGAGLPGRAAAVAGVAVVLVVGCNLGFVRAVGVGPLTLTAAAAGTSVGTGFALLTMGTMVYRRFGAFLPLPSLLRVLGAGAVAFWVARLCPHDAPLPALGALVAGGLSFLLALVVAGELGAAELAAARAVLHRRR